MPELECVVYRFAAKILFETERKRIGHDELTPLFCSYLIAERRKSDSLAFRLEPGHIEDH